MMRYFLLGLVNARLLTTQVIVTTCGVWAYIRGKNPMQAPGTQGITFWQFIQKRWDAYQAVDAGVSVFPLYLHFNLSSGRMVTVNGC